MRDGAPSILAIDLGTSETKAGLIDRDGHLTAMARELHPMEVDADSGCAEQDPEAWWGALRSAIGRLRPAMEGPVAAICCVGQGPTLVASDGAGRPTRAAVTWLDRRAAAHEAELERSTGLAGWGLGILPAARWLEVADPRAAEHTRWYLNSWEWAALRMTGTAAATRSHGQVLPDPDRAAAAGLASRRLPPVVDVGSVIGPLRDAAATDLGLTAGIPVVAGTVDSFASFHGAGLLDPGDAVDTGGTSGGLAVYWDSAPSVPGAWVAAAPLPGRWMVGGAMSSTGKALDWMAGSLLAGRVSPRSLLEEAAGVEPGAGGLVFLPYLAGERSPLWDPLARGAFVGLTLSHRRPHLVRAILEAAALALRHVAVPIRAAGIEIRELRMTGGTARGDTWNQIKADVLGVEVAVPEVRETALEGAAILAATAIGEHAGYREAIGAMVRIDRRLSPNQANRATYDALFEVYVGLWPAIEPLVHRLHELPG